MLSKAETARYGLWILGKDTFINSPYHDEDLKLLVETRDTNKENPLNFIVSDAIATVASNIDSIKSPYHQTDIRLIANSGSTCLQMSHSYPEHSLNNLAVNKVSLKDKYHYENMLILATNPIASKFLYIIMTNPNFIKGKNYRKEIEALVNAKSKTTAKALYYYIVNPNNLSDTEFLSNYSYISNENSVIGSKDPDYLKNLIKINEIDDELVMQFVFLLMNPKFINSTYKKFDLELLESISDKFIFIDLYKLMSNESSLSNKYHKKDAVIISQITNDIIRGLLLKKGCDEYSLNSINHEYDMKFITKLNLDEINEDILDEIYYYLFEQKGIDDPQHKEKLEKLLKGELVKRNNDVSRYLDALQNQINNSQTIELVPINNKMKTKILSLFNKIR